MTDPTQDWAYRAAERIQDFGGTALRHPSEDELAAIILDEWAMYHTNGGSAPISQRRAFMAACRDAGVTPAYVLKRCRERERVAARDFVMAQMYKRPEATLQGIGEWFGLDHSSVLAAIRRHKRREIACGTT